MKKAMYVVMMVVGMAVSFGIIKASGADRWENRSRSIKNETSLPLYVFYAAEWTGGSPYVMVGSGQGNNRDAQKLEPSKMITVKGRSPNRADSAYGYGICVSRHSPFFNPDDIKRYDRMTRANGLKAMSAAYGEVKAGAGGIGMRTSVFQDVCKKRGGFCYVNVKPYTLKPDSPEYDLSIRENAKGLLEIVDKNGTVLAQEPKK